MNFSRRILSLAALCWLMLPAIPAVVRADAAPVPDAIAPDGGHYYGQGVNGQFHGRHRTAWITGARYEGEFANGMMSGLGRNVACRCAWHHRLYDEQVQPPPAA